jgi:epoxide hydrolase
MQAWREMAARQSQEAGTHESEPSGPPMGVAVFAADTTIRSLMDPTGEIKHWSEFDRGGHFPAMEVPNLLVKDIRTFFRKFRELR